MLQDFKDFINKGNLVQLAVAFIMGTVFAAVVAAFVNFVVMDIIAAIVGKPSFDAIAIHWGKALGTVDKTTGGMAYKHMIHIGAFITQFINFLIIALAVFFIVKMYEKFSKSEEEEAGPTDTELLTDIRDLLQQRGGQA
ncbi:MAG TPA: large conductance mechanosensitive channel protein MscL [Acidimicrobiales bacterium]|nr:large conductance mechanosensitive channel protein MscL [Acidimicrobiales bacterium]